MTGETRGIYEDPWLLPRARLITICSAQVLRRLLLPPSAEPALQRLRHLGKWGYKEQLPSAICPVTGNADYLSLPELELKATLEQKCCPLYCTAQPCLPLQGNGHLLKANVAVCKAFWNNFSHF